MWNRQEGNFTIEASLVLPIVLITVSLLLFMCLYLYQKSFLLQASSAVSERSSFIWDNSHKEAVSGSVVPGLYDGLYWRLTDDHLISGLFGLNNGKGGNSLQLPGGSFSEGDLAQVKMSKAALAVPSGMNGEMRYDHQLFIRRVYTQLSWPQVISPLDRAIPGGMKLTTLSQSVIVDPVEFIRTVELMRYYGSKFSKSGSGGTNPAAASKVLGQYGGKTQ
ncbi:TadE family protein [Paenibacillus lemnae]|uniref:TadE family protein n=1 Tax=Paenibacillus lemnae TaxID=1330551 RepID=UPI0031B5DC69